MLSQQKVASPAHLQELGDDEDDRPLVRSDRTTVSEDEDDRPLVEPALKSETVKRESASIRIVPTQLRRRKGLPIWRDPCATWNKMCQKLRVSDQKSRVRAEIQTVRHSRT